VYFNLSGFNNKEYYDVLRNNTFYTRCLANNTGTIQFTNNEWSTHDFTILQACNSTGYEHGNWSFSEHLQNDVLEEDWVESNDTVWYTEDNSAWWPGNTTYVFNATASDFDVTILNNSGMNRTQLMGWTKINYTGESFLMYPMVIFNYQNNNSFDAVMFNNHEVYIVHYNGTNLTEMETGYTWENNELWTNHVSQTWEYYYPGGVEGVYFKLLYNTYPGKLKFKYWNPTLFPEPAGWACEYQHDNLSTSNVACIGLGGWNPESIDADLNFDLFNVWQLNYTTNSSATCTINDETFDRPHMNFPVLNMTNYVDWAEYVNATASENITIDNIRDIMQMVTNNMSLESRSYAPYKGGDTGDQNDTVYYYSCVYDELRNFTEEVTGDTAPDWLYDEYLHLHIQMPPDYQIENFEYEDLVVAIDTDDDGTWSNRDRVFWVYADDDYNTYRLQYNGNMNIGDPNFNASIWQTGTDVVGNLHRYGSHMNFEVSIPLAELLTSDGDPVNVSDVFGLHIYTTMGDYSYGPVWQNWNETNDSVFYPEIDYSDIFSYFTGDAEGEATFNVSSTELARWGEGVITSGEGLNASEELSSRMTVNVSWNDTVALAGEEWCIVNETIWVNNTGTGDLTDIWVNQTWWNCSCSDLNMTLVDSNLSLSNMTWYNDSCYWLLHNESLTLSAGESWSFWVSINITNCSGVSSTTDTVSTVGNASELTNDVTSDDGITFAWGFQPTVRISYESSLFGDDMSILYTGFIMFGVLAVALVGAYVFKSFNKKFEGGDVNL
jgi:hypothetical protein